MNVVNSGSRFLVYANDVKTYKNLPTGTYNVNFDKMAGFYLTSRNDLTCVEEKIYGNHSRRVKKVFTSYDASERNLGVILSVIRVLVSLCLPSFSLLNPSRRRCRLS